MSSTETTIQSSPARVDEGDTASVVARFTPRAWVVAQYAGPNVTEDGTQETEPILWMGDIVLIDGPDPDDPECMLVIRARDAARGQWERLTIDASWLQALVDPTPCS